MVVTHVLRYGAENLGRYFFGAFENADLAIKDAREYNERRGGKYPVIEIRNCILNKVEIFEEEPYFWNVEKNIQEIMN